MATMSTARIRSLCRRHNHALEAVYHFSANPVQHVLTRFSPIRSAETSPSPSADERFRAALRREMAKAAKTMMHSVALTKVPCLGLAERIFTRMSTGQAPTFGRSRISEQSAQQAITTTAKDRAW